MEHAGTGGTACQGEGTDTAKTLRRMSSKNSKKVCSWAGERKTGTGDEQSERHAEGVKLE